MTVTEKQQRKRIAASGFANPLTHDVYLESSSHLKVYADDTLLAIGTDYTVAELMNPTGYEVTMLASETGVSYFVLSVEPPIEQASDVSLGGSYGARFEDALDGLARRVQHLADRTLRALKMPRTTSTAIEYEVPAPGASQVIGWNADGTGLVNYVNPLAAETAPAITDAGFALLDDASADAQLVTLGGSAAGIDGFKFDFDTVALLIADTVRAYSNTTAGDYIRTRAEGFSYLVAASGASDHHVTTGGGLKLYAVGLVNLDQIISSSATETQTTAALQKVVDQGGLVSIPACEVRTNSTVTVDYSDPSFPDPTDPLSTRVDIEGVAWPESRIRYSGTGAAIHLEGSPVITAQGAASFDAVRNLNIYSSTVRTAGTIGLSAIRRSQALYENIHAENFATGFFFNSCLSSKFSNLHARYNVIGFNFTDSPTWSRQNALCMDRIEASGNTDFGIVGSLWGAGNVISGLTCEGNGTDATSTGGMFLNLNADNGLGSLVLNSPYFEGNKGLTDLYLDNLSTDPMTVTINGGVFNRNAAVATTNNICAASTGSGKLTIILIGCGFLSAGAYTPDAGEPYWATSGNVEILQFGCVFSSETPLPSKQTRNGCYAGSVNADGTAAISVKGITTTKLGTGFYRVLCAENFGASATGFVAQATCMDGTGAGLVVERINQPNANEILVITTNHAGTLADAPFNWSTVRIS